MTGLAQRAPLLSFVLVAFAFTWALLPLAASSIPVSLLALCGPAVGAGVVSALAGGSLRMRFRHRLTAWRAGVQWYLLALLLPLPVTVMRSGLERMAGAAGEIGWQPVTVLSLAVFVLVAGEEIGWRGFALPLLRERMGPWRASATLGALWALWHLPLFFMPGMPQAGSPVLAFVPYTIALSIILTILAERTGGSVLIATLFHGAVNTFGIVHHGATPALRGWSNALAYGVVAVGLGMLVWRGPAASASSSTGQRRQ